MIVASMNLEPTKERDPCPLGILHWCDNLADRAIVLRSKMGRPKIGPKTIGGKVHWRCSRCEQWNPETQFGVCRTRWNGFQCRCLLCQAAACAKSYRKNLDRNRALSVARSDANPEKVRRTQRKYRQKNRDRIREKRKVYERENPEKIRAQKAVGRAIRSGKLTRPDFCEACGAQPGRLEGHHSSYDRDRWLDVIWLCRKCHKFLHDRQSELLEKRA